MLRQASTQLTIRAERQGLHEFTNSVRTFVADSGIEDGLLTLFCRHTSASLVIQENAAPAARRDLEAYSRALRRKALPMNMTMRAPTTCPRI